MLGDNNIYAGQIIKYRITVLPFIRMYWETEIADVVELRSFTDIQKKGPYSRWSHKHIFTEVDGGIEMKDELEYAVPFGVLGRMVNFLFVAREVKSIFDYRYHLLNKYFIYTA